MSRTIPVPVIAIVSDVLAYRYTHSRISSFMETANIEYSPPGGNKVDKTRAWLRFANENCAAPLARLGKVITEFMEVNTTENFSDGVLNQQRERVNRILSG